MLTKDDCINFLKNEDNMFTLILGDESGPSDRYGTYKLGYKKDTEDKNNLYNKMIKCAIRSTGEVFFCDYFQKLYGSAIGVFYNKVGNLFYLQNINIKENENSVEVSMKAYFKVIDRISEYTSNKLNLRKTFKKEVN